MSIKPIDAIQTWYVTSQDPISQELEIDTLTRNIISQETLLIERAQLLQNVAKRELYLNVRQIGLSPTPLCPAYDKMRIPTVSDYNIIGYNMASITLDSSAIRFIPKQVLDAVGDISDKEVDLFWTAIDGRPLKLDRPLNLCTHPWSHPHALAEDDSRFDVTMGIFPEIGFQQSSWEGSLHMGKLSPMSVHVHSDQGEVLYSPDNAHFEVRGNPPFGIVWSVLQKDWRVAITKMLVIFDFEYPICSSLVGAIRDCKNLDMHVKKLQGVSATIDHTFTRIVDLFTNNPQNAVEEMRHLPLTFQDKIFEGAWALKTPPDGLHTDFGRASFLHEETLDQDYYCQSEERAAIIQSFANWLKTLLCNSQEDLLMKSQSLVKDDNIVHFLRCAQTYKNTGNEAGRKLFEQLSIEKQNAVFFAIWELSKCPRGNGHFGSETFYNTATPLALKKEALLLAASRQVIT